VEQGAYLLKTFHEEHEKNPTGRETEFCRGEIAGFRNALTNLSGTLGRQFVAHILDRVRQRTGLKIPHSGQLTPDGYLGFDSGMDV